MKKIFKYLNAENYKIIETVINNFIDKHAADILKLNNMSFNDFIEMEFNYYLIFEESIVKDYSYSSINVFYVVDKYIQDNELGLHSPEVRNSMYEIFKNTYKEFCKKYKFKTILDNKIITLFETQFNESQSKFNDIYSTYENVLNKKVISKCKWRMDYKLYNI